MDGLPIAAVVLLNKVTSPGLTFANYIASGIGNAALLNNTGEMIIERLRHKPVVFYFVFLVR